MLGSCSQVLVRIEREMKIPSLAHGHELWEVTERKRDTSGRIAAATLRSDSERCQLSWLGDLILMPSGLLTTKLRPTERRPRGRVRTCWKDCISNLA